MMDFKRKSIGLEINPKDRVKNFHSVDLWWFISLEMSLSREIGWGGSLFEIGALKLFKNSTMFPKKIGECPYFFLF